MGGGLVRPGRALRAALDGVVRRVVWRRVDLRGRRRIVRIRRRRPRARIDGEGSAS